MPELPEVEVLVRHLSPHLLGRTIRNVRVLDRRSIRRSTPAKFKQALINARFKSLERRGKYLVFAMRTNRRLQPLIGHLGMTGRLYLTSGSTAPRRHATVLFDVGRETLVFEDVRRFGGLTLDPSALARLGPEPLNPECTVEALAQALAGSRQPIKVKLLDQSVVAGIGNIYASEVLFQARIHPRTPSRLVDRPALRRLRTAIRTVLSQAIRFGSSASLNFGGSTSNDSLFYYGKSADDPESYVERLRVYQREGQPCRRCQGDIRKVVQAGRSTFFCPRCQNESAFLTGPRDLRCAGS